MAEEKRLTLLGKIVILLIVLGSFYGAWRMLGGKVNLPKLPVPGATTTAPRPAGSERTERATPLRSNVLAEIRRRGALAVGHEDDAAPMYFMGPGQQPDGFEYQLAKRLAAEIGVPSVKFVGADYAKLPDLLRGGQIDVIVAGYVPDPQVAGVEWSDSYLDFGLCLIVPKGSAITEVSHLAGRTVAVYDDPAAVRWVKDHVPGVKVKTFSGDSGWFEAVEKREADALIYDYPFAAEEIKRHPRTKIVKFNLNQSHYAVGVPAGNDALLDAVNQGLKRIMAAPEYAELVRHYLSYQSEDVTRPVTTGQKTYVVRPGDTLTTIAAARLGSKDRWEDIWQLNKERIPNPHLIYPDYVLIMP
jgi:ABC-type amino acid transport substrate-binding protein